MRSIRPLVLFIVIPLWSLTVPVWGDQQAPGDQPSSSAASATPKPVPQTRPEMKRLLESLKQRKPRLPLPPAAPSTEEGKANGTPRPTVNNGRMRALYLPESWSAGNNRRSAPPPGAPPGRRFPSDPSMSLDDTFKVKLFWIVSRGNNCYYCLGHQEHKLHAAGLDDDTIAALDSDWEIFPATEQAAMEFARKLTLTPQLLTAGDLMRLRPGYSDSRLIELVYTVASFNSTNRWTDSLGIPQDDGFGDQPVRLDTPTSEKYSKRPTQVIPATNPYRPELETRAEVEAALARCRARSPRVALLSEENARASLATEKLTEGLPDPLLQWQRALAYFPATAARQIRHLKAVAEEGRISPLLKSQIAWIAAREDRSWYAIGHAQQRLMKLGVARKAAYDLDGPAASFSPAERQAFAFARKLTSSPRSITDADIAGLRKHYGDHEVAEIVYVVCVANMFDRFTETLGLVLEE